MTRGRAGDGSVEHGPTPWRVRPTGRKVEVIGAMGIGLVETFTWVCVHCQHVDPRDRAYGDAWNTARNHYRDQHLPKGASMPKWIAR